MKECIYLKRYGGKKFGHLFCCHVWKNINKVCRFPIEIEKNECVDCGCVEIMILIDW